MLMVVLFSPTGSFSQETDTTFQKTQVQQINEDHSPTKAALYSAVLPGLGQVYNRKYWKVPILYAGGTFVYYLINQFNDNYNELSNAYEAALNDQLGEYEQFERYVNYTPDQIKAARDINRRYRDLNVIIMVGVYLVNVIDATVDAYLFNFDVSKDLTFKPAAIRTESGYLSPGLKITYQF
ncbi:MAG TPA: DUF5683 domain-containing protein [Bacteroidales bacterium]|nr:DUF5683 domain-containing protein [Bacteroidales bacterium]